MKRNVVYLLMSLLLLLAFCLSLSMGAIAVPLPDVILLLVQKIGLCRQHPIDDTYRGVIEVIRMPRAVMGLLVGSALGISGAAIQGVFRNPLAEPGLIGVSAGASLVAAGIIALETGLLAGLNSWVGSYVLALGAFAGAGIAAFSVYQISKSGGKPNVATMLLAGIAINALAGALTGLLSYLADERQLRSITFWMLGSLGGASWETIGSISPFILASVLFLPFLSKSLNAFSLGESQTNQLGMHADRVKSQVVVLSTMAVGASVAVSGIIGFVGLLVPHMVRLLGGVDNRFVLPMSALMGALTLTISDLLARTLISPLELPIGVVTALLGTPVFLYILIRDKKKILH